MDQTELNIFLLLVSIIILIFIGGIILFIFQYRKRKLLHEKEKKQIDELNRIAMLHAQVETQLQTMQFIGSEIHDSVAQKLTLASIYSQRLEFENKNADISERLTSISAIINDALTELRDLSKNLTDKEMQQSVFTELLMQECERVNHTGICRAVVQYDPGINISASVKSFLFRVVQEFIQNSLKHSGCNLITIDLQKKQDRFELILADNGKGFHPESVITHGMGLGNMKRRINLIGAAYSLASEEGQGTRLNIMIPNNIIFE